MTSDAPPNLARWPSLVRRAVVGTQASREPLELAADELSPLLAGASDDDVALLRAAGTLAMLRRGAAKPARAPSSAAGHSRFEPPADAPELERCSPEAAADLALAIAGNDRRLMSEWLVRAERARVRIAEELLPRIFDYGSAHRAARPAISAVAGERGRRLAALEPTWAYVLGEADFDEIWKFGELPARVAALAAERRRDPARAREALAAVWPSENAKAKSELLGALEAGLSADDEPFLEAALDDGNKAVRSAAAVVLSRLPGSAFIARAVAAADACVVVTGAPGRRELRVEPPPPESYTKAMRRDAYVETPPAGTGQRGFLLVQIIARVPPSHWQDACGLTPDETIALMAKNDYADVLLGGLARATAAFRDGVWAAAWLRAAADLESLRDRAVAANQGGHGRSPERRAAMIRLFDARVPGFAGLAATYPYPYEEDLASAALAFARWMCDQKTYAWRSEFATLLDELAFRIEPQLPQARAIWPEEFTFDGDARAVGTFTRTIEARARIRSHLIRKDA